MTVPAPAAPIKTTKNDSAAKIATFFFFMNMGSKKYLTL
jgi:hypothetical protein